MREALATAVPDAGGGIAADSRLVHERPAMGAASSTTMARRWPPSWVLRRCFCITTPACIFPSMAALLSDLLQTLQAQWPVPLEELVIVGHSMAGWWHAAPATTLSCRRQRGCLLIKTGCLASPHHGAPLERGGNWFHVITDVSALTRPFSQLGKIRSAGITDLRYGNTSTRLGRT